MNLRNSHKRFICKILLLTVTSLTLNGQKPILKEIKIEEQNGLKTFNIITNDIKINFNEDLEYNWYNEYSGEQSSKGASGGNLLHGKYSFFDENGRLNWQGYYYYGLQDSTWLFWNDRGEVTSKTIFKNGIPVFRRSKLGNGGFYESSGSTIGYPDYWYKEYSNNNVLISYSKTISSKPYPICETIVYFPDGKKVKSHSFSQGLSGYFGEYKEFNENGKLTVIGYYDKQYYLGLKTGDWRIYNKEKNHYDTIKYKIQENKNNVTNIKEIGSLQFEPGLNNWIKTGIWYYIRNDSIIDGKYMDSPIPEEEPLKQEADIVNDNSSYTIKLIKNPSGLFEIPVILNKVLKIKFIFDSGASEVTVSPDVALTLIRTGTISENDWLPDQTYVFADGSKAKSKRFVIRQLLIGNHSLSNIEASISNSIEAPMLIGQNVMNKLGSITIDYENQLLIINSK